MLSNRRVKPRRSRLSFLHISQSGQAEQSEERLDIEDFFKGSTVSIQVSSDLSQMCRKDCLQAWGVVTDSIYFRDPNGQLLELASYKFVPPEGYTFADVLATAHRLRLASGAYNITAEHLADAIAELTEARAPVLPMKAPEN